jgi:hypothetical protein
MWEDGWLIGYGVATALYDLPALERIHAAPPAALWSPVMPACQSADRAGSPRSCADRPPARARLAVTIRLYRRGRSS